MKNKKDSIYWEYKVLKDINQCRGICDNKESISGLIWNIRSKSEKESQIKCWKEEFKNQIKEWS